MGLGKLLDKFRNQTLTSRHDRPVVSLEEFFEGNDDEGSIGRGLDPHPGIGVFYERLRALRARSDVKAVLVAITEDRGNDVWPNTGLVYVLTSATEEDIEAFTAELLPHAIAEHDMERLPFALARLPPPAAWYRVLTITWAG